MPLQVRSLLARDDDLSASEQDGLQQRVESRLGERKHADLKVEVSKARAEWMVEKEVDLDAEVMAVKAEEDSRMIRFNFQVADVKKPLVAVKRIVENGNRVCFGPAEEDNFILNKRLFQRLNRYLSVQNVDIYVNSLRIQPNFLVKVYW